MSYQTSLPAGEPGLPDGCLGHAIMVEGVKQDVDSASSDIHTAWVQCTGPTNSSAAYPAMDGYAKQIGGYCEIKCEVSVCEGAAWCLQAGAQPACLEAQAGEFRSLLRMGAVSRNCLAQPQLHLFQCIMNLDLHCPLCYGACFVPPVPQAKADYGKVTFTRQFIGVGEESIGSAVSVPCCVTAWV